MNIEEIYDKIKAGKKLTDEEEMYYLTKGLGHTQEEAELIIAQGKNEDPNLLID